LLVEELLEQPDHSIELRIQALDLERPRAREVSYTFACDRTDDRNACIRNWRVEGYSAALEAAIGPWGAYDRIIARVKQLVSDVNSDVLLIEKGEEEGELIVWSPTYSRKDARSDILNNDVSHPG